MQETTLDGQIRRYADSLRAMRDAYLTQAEHATDGRMRAINNELARGTSNALADLHTHTHGAYGDPRVTTP